MKTNHIVYNRPKKAIHDILWIVEKKREGYVKKDYLDKDGVYWPITLDRLLYEAYHNGMFGVEIKKHCLLGEAGDVTILEFK